MGRKRDPKKIQKWDLIHNNLAEILQAMRYKKTSRQYIKAHYFGTGKQLRKNCIRILNLLEAMDEELKYELSTETRWT